MLLLWLFVCRKESRIIKENYLQTKFQLSIYYYGVKKEPSRVLHINTDI